MHEWQVGCPVSVGSEDEVVQLVHGEGARASRKLLEAVIFPLLNQPLKFQDAAPLTTDSRQLLIATDSHTVSPLFFPGGDIGGLSVYGTVNDLVVSGGVPAWITLGLIIEEGLPLAVMRKIVQNIAAAAKECGVTVVAGDTKVVPHGLAGGLYINSTGLGERRAVAPAGPSSLESGDCILVSGPIGRHGVAVTCARQDFQVEPVPRSDCGSLQRPVTALLDALGTDVRCIRDATRGGVSGVLHEWAVERGVGFELSEEAVPVDAAVRGVCELLGLDPLYVANEGTFVCAVAAGRETEALETLKTAGGCASAALIGRVVSSSSYPVIIRRAMGMTQPLDDPTGAPLPRIC